MKKLLFILSFSLFTLTLLNSCSTNRLSISENKPETEKKKDPVYLCFVQLNNGTTQYFASLELVTGLFKTPYLLADGKTKIYANEINAYQNKYHFAVSQSTFANGYHSSVATETLPGFAVRIAEGKINVYSKKYYNGQRVVDQLFLQDSRDQKIYAYTPDLMKTMLKDNPEALEYFKSKQMKKNLSKKLQAIAGIINNNQSMTRN